MNKSTSLPMIEAVEPRRLLSGFAPDSPAGLTIDLQDYTYTNDSNGFYRMELDSGGRYVILGTSGPGPAGTYTYVKTSDNNAVLDFSVAAGFIDANPASIPLSLAFTDPLTGSLYGVDSEGGGHPGAFVIEDGTAPTPPSSVAGQQFLCTIPNGGGTFQFQPKADGSYIVHVLSGPILTDSAGSYAYNKTGSQDASITLADFGQFGSVSGSLHFVSGDAGEFGVGPAAGEGLTGVFSLQGAAQSPKPGSNPPPSSQSARPTSAPFPIRSSAVQRGWRRWW